MTQPAPVPAPGPAPGPGPGTGTGSGAGTAGTDYAERLRRLSGARWKSVLGVQAPYAWNARRLCRGRVLEVGCGIGRNLAHLRGAGVGVDHNAESVATARSRGLEAYTPEEFARTGLARPGAFDTLLLAHVLEHVDAGAADDLLARYAVFLRRPARLVLVCPQERGWATDATHVRWVDAAAMAAHAARLGAAVRSSESFPLPRAAGKAFPYNEFVVVAELPAPADPGSAGPGSGTGSAERHTSS